MTRPRGYSWDDMADGLLFELANADGERLAEVAFQEASGMWSWYVRLPERFHFNNGNPVGLAGSAKAAQAICEGILHYTVFQPTPAPAPMRLTPPEDELDH